MLLRGDFELCTQSGERIDAGRRTVALCRCGGSAIKPFCDGTHKALAFRAGARPDPTPDGQRRVHSDVTAVVSADE